MKVSDLIIQSIRSGLSLQITNGSFPSGFNGPYKNPETPLRNTSHWLISCIYAYRVTYDHIFIEAARKALQYIKFEIKKSAYNAVECRLPPTRNKYNGLVGQAWIIEALCEAGKFFSDAESFLIASEISSAFIYSKTLNTWQLPRDANSDIILDRTINHNIWFAASLSMIPHQYSAKAQLEVNLFLDKLPAQLLTYSNNIIHHSSPFYANSFPTSLLRVPLSLSRNFLKKNSVYQKSVAYHAFNLYGLALIYINTKSISLFDKLRVDHLIEASTSPEFLAITSFSKYSYTYNPVGFEMAFTLSVFQSDKINTIISYLFRQISETYNTSSGLFDFQTSDPHTSAARLYEASRLLPFLIQKNK